MPVFILFIDTETTGLPRRRAAEHTDLDSFETCRVVEISAQLYKYTIDTDPALVLEMTHIIEPDGFTIENDSIHGITHATACFNGKPIAAVVKELAWLVTQADLLVAHNMNFDRTVLLSEMHRAGDYESLNTLSDIPTFCTMVNTKDILKITMYDDTYKYPKLTELYTWLFNRPPAVSHNALADVKTTVRCFFELLRRGYYSLA